MKLLYVSLMVLAIATSCNSGDVGVSKADLLGRKLVGKSSKRAASILESEFGQYYQFNSVTTCRENIGIERYQIGPLIYIHLFYEDSLGGINIADSDRVSRYEIASFSELTNRVSNVDYDLLDVIHRSPVPTSTRFDPVALTEAVNRLHSLGKTEALRVLKVYYDLAAERDDHMIGLPNRPPLPRNELRFKYDLDEQRIFLILRLLFVPKDATTSKMPHMIIGSPGPPFDKSFLYEWPLFPLVLVNGIPFLMIEGYMLAGVAESPLVHLEYCNKECVLRSEPLGPLTNAVGAVKQLVESESWKNLFTGQPSELKARYRQLLQSQAERVQDVTERNAWEEINKRAK